MVSFAAGAGPVPPADGRRNPALNKSLPSSTADAVQMANEKAAKTTSAWAAWQTGPLQKRSLLRKTARATKPENQNSTLEISTPRAM